MRGDETTAPRREEATLRTFGERWGFPNGDSPRLRAALTHRSAAVGVNESSERLEFLGDALLGAFVAQYLIEALPSDVGEDVLSRARVQVIRKETLAEAARQLGIPDLLTVGPGERKEQRHQRDSLLADAYEALVAALYLDSGYEAMSSFIQATLTDPLTSVTAVPPAPDPKTLLQMHLQSAGRGLPTYRLVSATGKGHDHHFIVEAIDTVGATLGRGEGSNKRTAEMEAARNSLTQLIPTASLRTER